MPLSAFLASLIGPRQAFEPALAGGGPVRFRYAVPDDADALARLARTDARRPPRGVVIVAEVGDQLWAAVSVDDDHAVADPRRPTGELVWILAERARDVRRAVRGRMQRLPRVWPPQEEEVGDRA